MIGWARYHLASTWCFVVRAEGGSLICLCRGRWSATDNYEIAKGDPPIDDCCPACLSFRLAGIFVRAGSDQDAADESAAGIVALIAEDVCRVTVGLDEVVASQPLFAWDMSDDAGGEG